MFGNKLIKGCPPLLSMVALGKNQRSYQDILNHTNLTPTSEFRRMELRNVFSSSPQQEQALVCDCALTFPLQKTFSHDCKSW